jgi:hypothetical protein
LPQVVDDALGLRGAGLGQQSRLHHLWRPGVDLRDRDELVDITGVGDRATGHQQVVLAPSG